MAAASYVACRTRTYRNDAMSRLMRIFRIIPRGTNVGAALTIGASISSRKISWCEAAGTLRTKVDDSMIVNCTTKGNEMVHVAPTVPAVEGRVIASNYSRFKSFCFDSVWFSIRMGMWAIITYIPSAIDAIWGFDSKFFRRMVSNLVSTAAVSYEMYLNTVEFIRDDSATGGAKAGQTLGMMKAGTQWVDAEGKPIDSLKVALCAYFESYVFITPPINVVYLGVQILSQKQQSWLQQFFNIYCVEA